jgi:hypothetical protein
VRSDSALYILDPSGEKPVPCPDAEEWAQWYENFDLRRVARAFIGRDLMVSTVFLAVDHAPFGGPPVLWETMVFRVSNDGGMEELDYGRCTGNREQAQAMHAQMCERLALELV